MLASPVEVKDITYPIMVTPKLDGIRCLIINNVALSRKFKPIPNKHIQELCSGLPSTLDGELICPNKTFNEIQSLVMTEDGKPKFEYHVFDIIDANNLNEPYDKRIEALETIFKEYLPDWCKIVLPKLVKNEQELLAYEDEVLKQGYEGVMIRSTNSPYKFGRSTVKEGYLLKLKRFKDSEALVIGFEEQLENNNVATKDELGHTKRSSHKANLAKTGTLGTLLVRDVTSGVEFNIGTGFDDKTRLDIWKNKDKYLGELVTYKYQDCGMKDKPRFPSFKGFRSKLDL